MGSLADLDRWAAVWINGPAGRSPLLDALVFDIAESLSLKGGLFFAVYWGLWFADRLCFRRALAAAMIGAVIAALLSRLLQIALPFHTRPLHTPDLGLHVAIGVDPLSLNKFSSFPSDHAFLFFALCVPLWRWSRQLGVAAAIWTLLVIGLPRIYLGYHYPSDVLGGAILGALTMIVAIRLLEPTALASWLVEFSERRPALFYGVGFFLTFEVATLFADLRHFGLLALRVLKHSSL